jgi:hypothetical protein
MSTSLTPTPEPGDDGDSRGPQPGEFPFRLLNSDTESPYLIWLRNHSSYLSVGGFLGGLTAGAIYIRGIIGNVLMLLPVLIPVGVVLGLLHPWIIEQPLFASRWPLGASVLLIFLFFGFRFGRPQDQLRQNRFLNGLAGTVMSILLLSAIVDLSPRVTDYFRHADWVPDFGPKECLAFIISLAGIAGVVVKFIPRSQSIRRGLALGLLGVLGIVLIWTVVLRISYYTYYGVPPTGWKLAIPQICIGIVTGSFAIAAVCVREWGRWARGFVFVLVLIAGGYAVLETHRFAEQLRHHSDRAMESVGAFVRPLSRIADGLEKLPNASAQIERIVERKRALDAESRFRVQTQGGFADRHEWVPNTVLQPGYYFRAQRLLEEVQSLKSDDPMEVGVLLDFLAHIGFQDFVDRTKLAGDKALPMSEVLLDSWLRENVPVLLVDATEPDQLLKQPFADIITWIEKKIPVGDLRKQLLAERLPVSMASDYFSVVANSEQDPEQFADRSSPDATMAGPHVFTDAMLGDDTLLQERLHKSVLSHLIQHASSPVADVVASIPVDVFSKRERELADGRRIRQFDVFIALVEAAVDDEDDLNPDSIVDFCKQNADRDEPNSIGSRPTPTEDKQLARELLTEFALDATHPRQDLAKYVVAEIYHPHVPSVFDIPGEDIKSKEAFQEAIYERLPGTDFPTPAYEKIVAARILPSNRDIAESTIRRMVFGTYGDFEDLENAGFGQFTESYWPRLLVVGSVWIFACVFCWFFVNPNLTSIHAFYRDRLAEAFILCPDGQEVRPERVVRLSELCSYSAGGSKAPYHLINTALNMTTKDDQSIRDRNADFFFFSKLFCGGRYTGFIRTDQLESACPEFTAASAMAISAGAASPNMGKYTSSVLTFLLSLLNVRLGHWVPNPAKLQEHSPSERDDRHANYVKDYRSVMYFEHAEIRERRRNSGDVRADIELEQEPETHRAIPTTRYKLLGLGFSGGGIRSAAVNLGIAQILDQSGVLKLVDYLSTVSGGGYVGTGMSTFMRADASSEVAAVAGAGRDPNPTIPTTTLWRRLRWRPPFWLFLNEMIRFLRVNARWLNLSDGGHVENSGAYELLRRQCEVVIVGDAEEDAVGAFPGLSALTRLAQIDQGIRITFEEDALLHLTDPTIRSTLPPNVQPTRSHFAVGTIHYPPRAGVPGSQPETGYLLYIRASLVGDEDQVIAGYKRSNEKFPNESTADQQFNEVQFEAYRGLGQKMMESILRKLNVVTDNHSDAQDRSYDEMFEAISTFNSNEAVSRNTEEEHESE